MWYELLETFELSRREIDLHMGCMLLKVLQYFVVRRSQYFMDLINLIKFVISREKWTQRENFIHYTAYAPNVHFIAIVSVGKQAFRGSIPSCGDVFCQWLILIKAPATTQIG